MRYSVYIATSLLLLSLFLGLLLAPVFIDWGRYRTSIDGLLSETLGEKVTTLGKINVFLLPFPTLSLTDVRIGTEQRPYGYIERVDLQLSLPSLFQREKRFTYLELKKPRFLYHFDTPETSLPEIEKFLKKRFMDKRQDGYFQKSHFERITIFEGTLAFQEKKSQEAYASLHSINMSVTLPEIPGILGIEGSGLFQNQALTYTLRASLLQNTPEKIPVSGKINFRRAENTLSAPFPPQQKAFSPAQLSFNGTVSLKDRVSYRGTLVAHSEEGHVPAEAGRPQSTAQTASLWRGKTFVNATLERAELTESVLSITHSDETGRESTLRGEGVLTYAAQKTGNFRLSLQRNILPHKTNDPFRLEDVKAFLATYQSWSGSPLLNPAHRGSLQLEIPDVKLHAAQTARMTLLLHNNGKGWAQATLSADTPQGGRLKIAGNFDTLSPRRLSVAYASEEKTDLSHFNGNLSIKNISPEVFLPAFFSHSGGLPPGSEGLQFSSALSLKKKTLRLSQMRLSRQDMEIRGDIAVYDLFSKKQQLDVFLSSDRLPEAVLTKFVSLDSLAFLEKASEIPLPKYHLTFSARQIGGTETRPPRAQSLALDVRHAENHIRHRLSLLFPHGGALHSEGQIDINAVSQKDSTLKGKTDIRLEHFSPKALEETFRLLFPSLSRSMPVPVFQKEEETGQGKLFMELFFDHFSGQNGRKDTLDVDIKTDFPQSDFHIHGHITAPGRNWDNPQLSLRLEGKTTALPWGHYLARNSVFLEADALAKFARKDLPIALKATISGSLQEKVRIESVAETQEQTFLVTTDMEGLSTQTPIITNDIRISGVARRLSGAEAPGTSTGSVSGASRTRLLLKSEAGKHFLHMENVSKLFPSLLPIPDGDITLSAQGQDVVLEGRLHFPEMTLAQLLSYREDSFLMALLRFSYADIDVTVDRLSKNPGIEAAQVKIAWLPDHGQRLELIKGVLSGGVIKGVMMVDGGKPNAKTLPISGQLSVKDVQINRPDLQGLLKMDLHFYGPVDVSNLPPAMFTELTAHGTFSLEEAAVKEFDMPGGAIFARTPGQDENAREAFMRRLKQKVSEHLILSGLVRLEAPFVQFENLKLETEGIEGAGFARFDLRTGVFVGEMEYE